jgi:hypothetical protein
LNDQIIEVPLDVVCRCCQDKLVREGELHLKILRADTKWGKGGRKRVEKAALKGRGKGDAGLRAARVDTLRQIPEQLGGDPCQTRSSSKKTGHVIATPHPTSSRQNNRYLHKKLKKEKRGSLTNRKNRLCWAPLVPRGPWAMRKL